jgi:hypothetical protein
VPNHRQGQLHVPLERDTFDVILHAKQVTSLYGYALELRYGKGLALIPSLREAATEGLLLKDQTSNPTLFFTQHDEDKHLIRLVGCLTGKHPGIDGSGEIARMQFRRLNDNLGAITLEQIEFADSDFNYNQVQGSQTIALKVVPKENKVLQNHPNPFNPETWIPYYLAEGCDVQLTIYNQKGELVRRIDLGHKPEGVYTSRGDAIYWNGRNDQGEKVASGLYFYQIKAGRFQQVRRMLLLK